MLTIAALALFLTACGTDAGAGTGTAQPTGVRTSSHGDGVDELTITYVEKHGAKPQRWTLRCSPPGGTHADPAAACAALERASASGRDAFAPVPKDTMCTEIYGGAQTATITGSWRGRTINSSFDRTNGCEIARWDALLGLLPRGGVS